MDQNREFVVYYKTYKKGLKVHVNAKNRAEAIKIVKNSIRIIKVDEVFNQEASFNNILKDTSFVNMFKRGCGRIFKIIKKLFINDK